MYDNETPTERVTRQCARTLRISSLRQSLRTDTGEERVANLAELDELIANADAEARWRRSSVRRPTLEEQ